MRLSEILEARYHLAPTHYDVYVRGKPREEGLTREEAEQYIDSKVNELERMGTSYDRKDVGSGVEITLASGGAELVIEIRPAERITA